MARPGLLIGLGGTGQWVLTHVKKELLEHTSNDQVPREVRLVAFDTARLIDEKKKRADEEEPVVIDGVRLDIGEFYHLGGNIEKTVREIVEQGRHPHISSWLQAKTYLTRLGAGQYVLEEGAGQMRPFGRMAIFKDLEANPDTSTIFGTIQDAISAIRSEVKENRNLEISIVASLAGGTGAGMAIDIAHIARTIAENVIGSQKFVLRGFFVLPRAFHQIPGGDSQDMRARSFAAIRELSRFLTVFGDRQYPMVYNQQPAFRNSMQRPVTKRLFDLCYLVDAHRERNSLDGIEPKYGIFPSIADALLSFLDEKSGQAHTEHVKNVTRELVKPDAETGHDVAYFSALGTFTFTLPIHDIAEESSCRLAIDFLNKLVRPELNDEGAPIRLSAQHNEEVADQRGSEVGDNFLRHPEIAEGVRGTLLLPEVARTIDKGHERNDDLIEEATRRSNLDWLRVIEPDEINDEVRETRIKVRTILEHTMSKDVKSSRERNAKPEHDIERLEREVAHYRAEYLGREMADGTTSGGKFHNALDSYEQLQTERYQRGLGEFVIGNLNGVSRVDPGVAKGAKLGFVQEMLATVADRLDTYCKFLGRVRESRTREGRLQLQREQVQAARGRMFEDRKKVGLLQKAGYRSQEEYLELMAQLIEYEKDEMVFECVSRIAHQLRDHTLALRGVCGSWARLLALGSAAEPSLYDALHRAQRQVRARRERARNLARVRHEETDREFEEKLYGLFASDQMATILSSVSWELDEDGTDISLTVLDHPLMRGKRRERDRPVDHNLRLLLAETGKAFQRLAETESISQRLMSNYQPDKLGRELHDNGSPLFSEKERPTFGQAANFLSVKMGLVEGDQSYFQEVAGTLRSLSGAKGQQAQLVESEGAHRCTLVYTKDVLNVDCMTTYDDLYRAYGSYQDDRRLLHNFPAEVNAVYYEQRLTEKLQRPYRLFSPRIVFLLEHRDWVQYFTRCLVHELVKVEQDDERNPFYAVELPACELKGRSFEAQTIELTPHATAGKPDILNAMDTFVFRQKDIRQEFEIPIGEPHLKAALVQCENTVGSASANIEKIKKYITEGEIQKFKGSSKVFEKDLGDLMHLVLLDDVDRLSVS